VPPFLADTLRAEADWDVSPAGIEQVIERARQMRLSLDPPPAPGGPAVSPAPPAVAPNAN
jgi:hypothetical protein